MTLTSQAGESGAVFMSPHKSTGDQPPAAECACGWLPLLPLMPSGGTPGSGSPRTEWLPLPLLLCANSAARPLPLPLLLDAPAAAAAANRAMACHACKSRVAQAMTAQVIRTK